MLKKPGVLQIILSIVNLAAVYFTAKIEEKEMIRKFSSSYLEYMNETSMFIPFVL